MNPKDFKIGIIGGGQLGKMLIEAAKQMDLSVIVLDPSSQAPGGKMADKHIVADFYNKEKIRELVEQCDVTTFEIEHIDTDVLCILEEEGHRIYPSPKTLEKIKDKSLQKEILEKNSIPTAPWQRIIDIREVGRMLGLPFVQKSCRGGYDGRGVLVIKNEDDYTRALPGETFGEKYVDFEKELAVIVARSIAGDIRSFPVVEMAFDERANICDTVIAPGRISEDISIRAREIAIRCIEAFEGVGVFGVELFLTRNGEILVNEIAPRVHNSGHYTIESCITSQFQQHIRAISGMPLGDTGLNIPSVVLNILGEKSGYPFYKGINEALRISGVNIHIYGKDTVKPFRKMGHVTIVDNKIENAIEKSKKVKKVLRAVSREEN